MNIIIKNKNRIIDSLVMDSAKTLVGEFDANDLSRELTNIEYSKVIIDITAIKNYYDYESLYNFLIFFPIKENIIIVLNNDFFANSNIFLSKLIENGYYNFATSDSAINNLLNKSNTKEDIYKYINGNDYLNEKSILAGREISKSFNFNAKIIGIENGIKHSGATTLMYMLVKELSKSKKVLGIEMNGNDSKLFNDDRIICCETLEQLKAIIKTLTDIDVFIIDLNNTDAIDLCSNVYYVIEPGIIKLNKLIKGDPNHYEFLKNKKIIINRSNINSSDIDSFAYETKLNIIANIPNLDERNNELMEIKKLLKNII